MATGFASFSITTSIPARTRSISEAKLLAASASETWITGLAITGLYTANNGLDVAIIAAGDVFVYSQQFSSVSQFANHPKCFRIGARSNAWACSSAGRAPRLQRGGRRFDPCHVHQLFFLNIVSRRDLLSSKN